MVPSWYHHGTIIGVIVVPSWYHHGTIISSEFVTAVFRMIRSIEQEFDRCVAGAAGRAGVQWGGVETRQKVSVGRLAPPEGKG